MADHDSIDSASSIAVAAQPVQVAAISPNGAATKVFGVFELAEQILLELKTEDLFRAQRVCRQWRAVIESSSPCRKALFLEPGTAEDVHIDNVYTPIVKSWQSTFKLGQELTATASYQESADSENSIAFNPLLVRKLARDPGEILTKWSSLDPTRRNCLHSNLLHVGENASCRKMFISQPPLPFMTISVEVANEALNESLQHGFALSIAQELWTPKDKIVVETVSPAKPCGLGQGTTLGELKDSLHASLKDYRKPHTDALWTFARTESRRATNLR
ncbi:hypothetical protein HII31_06726 [Pseudocercospora fuligena]|uniref:F-box domain-containing protein n=1 Tax=Pseudocercospora fuligena TaxID=685502 RepID=A0A8H6RKW3_9PEZI|nr:hypothetical protein HII31_06726 [Pseudocercospora fuligena]